VPTYNHGRYIGQAIESIATQKTTFPFRIIVSDDVSKDNTREIIKEYAAKYPGIVFPVFHEKNLGALGNGYSLMSSIKSKYVATCDGDDYWTDPYKLQKQVDFLEANPDFAMCFTDVDVLDQLQSNEVHLRPENQFPKLQKDVFTVEDIILADINIAPTPTLLFRNVFPQPIPEFFLDSLSADIFIQVMVTDKGKAKYMREKTAVYRNHEGGVTKSAEGIEAGERGRELLFNNLNKYYNYKYDKLFKKRLLNIARTKLISGSKGMKGMAKLKNYMKVMPDYIKYSDKLDLKEFVYYHMVLFTPFLLPKKK
jgi:glycosyltransferase involved in cell wall biosynthesis